MEEEQNMIVALAGESCQFPGIYRTSDCGHADVQEFGLGDVFPHCEICGQQIRWMKMRKPPQESGSKPICF
jgi:hypothetical protein